MKIKQEYLSGIWVLIYAAVVLCYLVVSLVCLDFINARDYLAVAFGFFGLVGSTIMVVLFFYERFKKGEKVEQKSDSTVSDDDVRGSVNRVYKNPTRSRRNQGEQLRGKQGSK